MQLLMIISLSFSCHCCFLLFGKKENPPALFCLQEVTSNNKTLGKLQDIQKEMAFYSCRSKKRSYELNKNNI